MEKDKVPQDDSNVLEGKLKVLKYAVDENGKYTQVPTVGWEPENIVLSQAWEEINEKVESVRKRVLANELSPIAYYMEKQMLDIKMLAQYVGYFGFRVKMHLKPANFKRLSENQLDKYANAFQITKEQLLNID
ncbi:MAG: hypothetical protein H0V01_08930 [Bacteroidetes bacterium]|nr:hypothetical protein [Bacteroidota bacterium]HET6244614.1 hypothetical protein [Bacteroidia bacterium]